MHLVPRLSIDFAALLNHADQEIIDAVMVCYWGGANLSRNHSRFCLPSSTPDRLGGSLKLSISVVNTMFSNGLIIQYISGSMAHQMETGTTNYINLIHCTVVVVSLEVLITIVDMFLREVRSIV